MILILVLLFGVWLVLMDSMCIFNWFIKVCRLCWWILLLCWSLCVVCLVIMLNCLLIVLCRVRCFCLVVLLMKFVWVVLLMKYLCYIWCLKVIDWVWLFLWNSLMLCYLVCWLFVLSIVFLCKVWCGILICLISGVWSLVRSLLSWFRWSWKVYLFLWCMMCWWWCWFVVLNLYFDCKCLEFGDGFVVDKMFGFDGENVVVMCCDGVVVCY